jgi:hypothetical protein
MSADRELINADGGPAQAPFGITLDTSFELASSVLFPQMQGKNAACKIPIRMAAAQKLSV